MDIASKFYTAGLGFLFTLVFGFWLSRRGKPYNGLLFNIHKLIALATVILTFLAVRQVWQTLDTDALTFLLLFITAVGVIALFASGAFMSANKFEYRAMKKIHNIAPVLVVLAIAGTIYLLAGGEL